MKFEWELLEGYGYNSTHRAKVIGGWIVKKNDIEKEGLAVSMVFIPDANHKWNLEEEKPFQNHRISDLDLLARTKNILFSEDIFTLYELINTKEGDLLKAPNLGKKTIMDIKICLEKLGLSLMKD